MPKFSHSSIKFGFWKIGGLCKRGMNKAEDSIFLKDIEPYDIMFLVETHIGYNSKIHNIGRHSRLRIYIPRGAVEVNIYHKPRMSHYIPCLIAE
jgi:hypothetical protein